MTQRLGSVLEIHSLVLLTGALNSWLWLLEFWHLGASPAHSMRSSTPCLMQTRRSCNSGMSFLNASSILHNKNTSGIIPHPHGCVKNIVQNPVTGLRRDIATTLTPLFHTLLDFSLHMHNNISCYHITSKTRRRWEHSEARKQNSSFMSWQKAERIVRPCSTACTAAAQRNWREGIFMFCTVGW